MIIVEHNKIGDMGYVSHKDTLRVLQRALKRAKIDVAYSKGFVPHMLTYTTTPLPLGVQSCAEYFGVECTGVTADEFLEKFNKSVPRGLVGSWAVELPKNPNLAFLVVASEYRIKASGNIQLVTSILDKTSYVIDTVKKGEPIQKEIRDMIFDIKVEGDEIVCVLATGNTNLRVDSFVESLTANFGITANRNSIVRTKQLVNHGGKLVSVGEFLR